MARIYKNASQVLVFLGQGTPDSDAAMRCIREIDEPSNDDGYGSVEASATIQENQSAVSNLFKRPWFFRVWVLQEITFARKATVICGDYQLSWESFKTFSHWNVNAGWIQRLPFSVKYAVSPTPYVLHITYGERLLKILEDTRTCGATDIRDKLYSVLPLLDRHHDEMKEELEEYKERWDYNEEELQELAIRQQRLNVQLDYSHSVSRVYTDLAILLMGSVGLDVLSYVAKESAIPGLPTWVPDWSVILPTRLLLKSTLQGDTNRLQVLKIGPLSTFGVGRCYILISSIHGRSQDIRLSITSHPDSFMSRPSAWVRLRDLAIFVILGRIASPLDSGKR